MNISRVVPASALSRINFNRRRTSATPATPAEITAYLATLAGYGVTPGTGYQAALRSFGATLQTAGIWSKLNLIWIPYGTAGTSGSIKECIKGVDFGTDQFDSSTWNNVTGLTSASTRTIYSNYSQPSGDEFCTFFQVSSYIGRYFSPGSGLGVAFDDVGSNFGNYYGGASSPATFSGAQTGVMSFSARRTTSPSRRIFINGSLHASDTGNSWSGSSSNYFIIHTGSIFAILAGASYLSDAEVLTVSNKLATLKAARGT
jgi:hypothetical protein